MPGLFVLAFRSSRVWPSLTFAALVAVAAAALCDTPIATADDVTPHSSHGTAKLTPRPPASSRRTADQRETESEFMRLTSKSRRLFAEGQVDAALSVQREIVAVAETHEGKTCWTTAYERALLAEMEHVSKLPEAKKDDYVVALKTLNNGRQRTDAKLFDDADSAYRNALEGFARSIGENSVHGAIAVQSLSANKLLAGNPQESKELALRAAAAWEVLLGREHPKYTDTLVIAGAASQELNELDEAESFFRNALMLQRRIVGANSIDYANTLTHLALTLISQEKMVEAEAVCLQAATIVEGTAGAADSLLASLAYSLAKVNIHYMEYRDAEKNLRWALVRYEQVFPAGHKAIIDVSRAYAGLLRKMGCQSRAAAVEREIEEVHLGGVRSSQMK